MSYREESVKELRRKLVLSQAGTDRMMMLLEPHAKILCKIEKELFSSKRATKKALKQGNVPKKFMSAAGEKKLLMAACIGVVKSQLLCQSLERRLLEDSIADY